MGFNAFDVATKELVWEDPAAWLVAFGLAPKGPVEIIEIRSEGTLSMGR